MLIFFSCGCQLIEEPPKPSMFTTSPTIFRITKVKIPPVWVKETFMDFKAEVESWEKSHPGDDYVKYCELLNELKRKVQLINVHPSARYQ